jgi:hypothetical protein
VEVVVVAGAVVVAAGAVVVGAGAVVVGADEVAVVVVSPLDDSEGSRSK